MSDPLALPEEMRDRILADPELILDDTDVMNALVGASERSMGGNIVDMRGLAMQRMEGRLDQLEDTHRNVIAAAYENLAGTNQVHRAILQMMDPLTFADFLTNLNRDVAQTLRVDCVRLVLESVQTDDDPTLRPLGEVLYVAEPGFVSDYLTVGRRDVPRPVTLRPVVELSQALYSRQPKPIWSEALMLLDLGPGRLPGVLAFGSCDPHLFKPAHGTDLLAFFGGVFERAMRRWLA